MSEDHLSKFDQASAMLGDNLPLLWKRLYEKCIEVGFSENDALCLVRTYLHAAAGGSIEK